MSLVGELGGLYLCRYMAVFSSVALFLIERGRAGCVAKFEMLSLIVVILEEN